MGKLIGYLISAATIILFLMIGNTVQTLSGLPIPGSVIGLLLLFSALATGVLPSRWVEPSASLLIKYMILLFVPVSVGLMQHTSTIMDNFWTIIISTVGGSLLVLVAIAVTLEKLLMGSGEKASNGDDKESP